MATINIEYSADTTITCGVASLGSSSTFTSGRESTEINNTSNLYVDALVRGHVRLGTSAITADTAIKVHVWGNHESIVNPNEIDVLDGADSAETLTNEGVLHGMLRVGAVIPVLDTTISVTYYFAPFSVASLFGGIMPKYWGLFVAHNTGNALSATAGDHEFLFNGITYTSA